MRAAAAPRLRPRPVRRPAPLRSSPPLHPARRRFPSHADAAPAHSAAVPPIPLPRDAVTGSMRAAAPVLGLGGVRELGGGWGQSAAGVGGRAWAPAPTPRRGELPPCAAGTAAPPRSEGSGSGPARRGRFSPRQGAVRCPPPVGGWQMAPAPSAPLCLPPAGSVSAKRALPKPHKYLLGISSTYSGQSRDV